jgi:UDPglucose 6-dehydrogenase
MRVTVIGTGYVGTVTGACLAYLGHRVTCVDTDLSKIEKLRLGQPPIFEPGLEELIACANERGGMNFETDLEDSVRESDVIFIAVGTPPLPSGESNLTYLESAARGIGAAMDASRFRVIVNKSTVPVGSGNLVETLVREGILESHPDLSDNIAFGVASNPEFLREGSAIHDSLYPDRIVVGSDDPTTLEMMRQLYAPLTQQQFADPSFAPRPEALQSRIGQIPIVATSITSAEMIKYSANAFLALKIGFSNEMANICERVGADATEVMLGIGLDWRIGRGFLNAGIGWGGSCFGKDISSLLHTAAEYGYQARILEASLAVIRMQRSVVIQKLQEKLYILKGRTVALLGLAFKPNTDDLRDAPSLQIAEKLIQMGVRVRAYDPVAMDACREQYPDLRIIYCNDALSAAEHADAIVLVTEWPEFANLSLPQLASRMNKAVLIDGRNLFQPDLAREAGFEYAGIGRASHRPAGNGHPNGKASAPIAINRIND